MKEHISSGSTGGPPRRRKPHLKVAVVAGLICFVWVSHHLLAAWKLSLKCSGWAGAESFGIWHPVGSASYGHFPKADDPFLFLPCTNTTVPPALDDKHPEKSWRQLYRPDPKHWSWGTATSVQDNPNDPFAGRGIYLCGYLDVPLDYTNSSDKRITRLAVTKYQVSGLARLDGSTAHGNAGRKSIRTIVINPGGPGGSGTSYVWRAAEQITQRLSNSTLDVLGWDPRGVNTTQPAVSCFPYDVDRDRWSLLTGQYREVSAAPAAQLELADAMNAATFHACKERHGDLGRFVSTAFVARDLEELRKTIGEEELTGYLVSYGTGIGQTYANMFPDSVGRVILDGTEYVRDHRLLAGFGWTALDNVTDAWHDGFLGECLAAGPKHCALAKPKGGREVSLEALEDRMDSLITSLVIRPVPGYYSVSGPSLVTYSALIPAIYRGLYSATSWPALAQMLYELEDDNSTLAVAFLETHGWAYDPTVPSPPSPKPHSEDLGLLVICADSYDAPEPPDGLAWWSDLWANMTARSWIAGNSRFFDVFPCRHFARHFGAPAEVYRGDLNRTLRHPVLLIAETYDPATPLRNGRRLLAEMGRNARLVAHHGYGHSSRDASACTDAIARAYILDGTLPDEAETACYADGKPYRYKVGAADSAFDAEDWDPIEEWRKHREEMAVFRPSLA